MKRLLHLALALVTASVVSNAMAHAVDKGLATISIDGQSVTYHLLLAISDANPRGAAGVDLRTPGSPADPSALLSAVQERVSVSANDRPCTLAASSSTPPNPGALVAVDLRFACAETSRTLDVHDNLFDVMGAQYHTIASVQWPGGSQQFVFTPQARVLRVETAESGASRSAGSFFALGVEHILIGWDHLLFLLMLILRGGNLRSLLKIVTAFTVAHSLTLALAALGIVTLPERLVEAVIALSIAYVAAENLFRRETVSHRWMVSFLFGLVHGFGFSNVLHELGLPQAGLLWSLLNFNLGVECGQAVAILVVMPVLFWLRELKWEPRAIVATSTVVLAVGLSLFIDRAWLPGS